MMNVEAAETSVITKNDNTNSNSNNNEESKANDESLFRTLFLPKNGVEQLMDDGQLVVSSVPFTFQLLHVAFQCQYPAALVYKLSIYWLGANLKLSTNFDLVPLSQSVFDESFPRNDPTLVNRVYFEITEWNTNVCVSLTKAPQYHDEAVIQVIRVAQHFGWNLQDIKSIAYTSLVVS